jgi:hypothetical protein
MLTKRFLLKKIEDLQNTYSNIVNFDELYKKIMDSYQNSKSFVQKIKVTFKYPSVLRGGV